MLGLAIPTRPGELTGLCWNDIDLDNGVIHFRRALHLEAGPGQFLVLGPLKTPQSRRSIALPQFVTDALWRRRDNQTTERAHADDAWTEYAPEHGGLVFTTEIGTPIDPASLRRTLRKLATTAEIPGHWTVYELRHSAVSILSAAGVPLEQIADTAGHKNAHITSVVYRHNLAPVITSARGAMDDALGPRPDDG